MKPAGSLRLFSGSGGSWLLKNLLPTKPELGYRFFDCENSPPPQKKNPE
jgi:hypothetical protein